MNVNRLLIKVFVVSTTEVAHLFVLIHLKRIFRIVAVIGLVILLLLLVTIVLLRHVKVLIVVSCGLCLLLMALVR